MTTTFMRASWNFSFVKYAASLNTRGTKDVLHKQITTLQQDSASIRWGGALWTRRSNVEVLIDLIRRAHGSGRRKQRHRGRGFNQGGVQDDWQGHRGDAHLQGGRQRLQDEGGLIGGKRTLGGGYWHGGN